MSDIIYNSFQKHLAAGDIDLDADTIKVMLVTSGYTPDRDNHEYKSQVTNEVSGTGYTAGGAALTGTSVTQDNTNDVAVFNADDVTWAASEVTAAGAVVYKDTGNPSTSPLVVFIDFGGDRTTYVTDFTIQWNADGIISWGQV
jgi:predicted enzyme related to lactoylglutathione lyase